MSSKPKGRAANNRAEKPGAPESIPKLELMKPSAPLPRATVLVRHEGKMVERDARGFSMGELAATRMPAHLTGSWEVPTDARRRSALEANTNSLKKRFTGTKKA